MRHPAFFSGARTRMEAMSMKRILMDCVYRLP